MYKRKTETWKNVGIETKGKGGEVTIFLQRQCIDYTPLTDLKPHY